MTTAEEASRLRSVLIGDLIAAGLLRSPAVEAALRAVPRHLFLPSMPLEEVYRDQPIVTKRIDGIGVSSSSQPAIMAVMLEQLDLRPGQRVLEIGAGTGYNAALLAHLVGPTGHVVTIDIDADIVETARQHLDRAGFERVEVMCGDGGLGHLPGAPYDRVILTVGAWDIAPAWWAQLRIGGRLVLPLSLRGPETQRSIAFDRQADRLESASMRPCGFMPLRGAFAGPIQHVQLGPTTGLRLVQESSTAMDAQAVFQWLKMPGAVRRSGVRTNSLGVAGGLNLWLALHDSRFCAVRAEGTDADTPFAAAAPYGYGRHMRIAVGLLDDRGLSLLGRARRSLPVIDDDRRTADEWTAASPSFELEVRSFGADDGVGQDLLSLVRAWDASGWPNGDGLHVSVYPRDVHRETLGPERIICKQWTRLALDWT